MVNGYFPFDFMTKKRILSIILLAIICLAFFAVSALAANDAVTNLGAAADGTGLKGKTDLWKMVGGVIQVVIGLTGVLLLGILIYAGISWGFLAKGDPTQIKKAQQMIINAVVGLLLVFASLALTNFILSRLNAVVTGNG